VDPSPTVDSGPVNRQELLRDNYAGNALEARRRLVVFYDYCAASDVSELVRLARTIARWETPILRWHHTRLTNATTEGTNLIVKNIKRLSVNRPSSSVGGGSARRAATGRTLVSSGASEVGGARGADR
jgi:Transposase